MKVVIIGGNTKPQYLNPYDDWDWWGLNAIRPKWSIDIPWAAWFNLHRIEHLIRDWAEGLEKERAWAAKNKQVPFYVIGEADWRAFVPSAVEFPLHEIAELPRGGRYHAGSIDLMVAYAISRGVCEIALHGIGLAMESGEPISARPCLEYWCGVAEGRGIKVNTAEDCDIFAQYHLVKSHSIYGYDDVRLVEDRT